MRYNLHGEFISNRVYEILADIEMFKVPHLCEGTVVFASSFDGADCPKSQHK